MRDMRYIIMCNKINARVFTLRGEVYIVGGYLRDVLQGKIAKDIDYIVRGNIQEFARLVYDAIGLRPETGTLIELKKEQMIRIVLKNGVVLDFTELKGDLHDDLKERDFTMNAILWSPRTGLIDLFDGLSDIKKSIIRAISIDNFKNDPLRLLRVYRFASELGWNVDIRTRNMVKALKREIKRSASERITMEFFKLLNSTDYNRALEMALKDGLLECFLAIPHKKLSDNIRGLHMLESTIKKVPERFRINLKKPFSQGLILRGLLRLEQILAGSILSKNRLRLSSLILERLKVVHKLLPTAQHSLFTASNMFDIFFKAKDGLLDFLILTGNIKFLNKAERFKRIWRKSFLTAEDIMEISKIMQGVELGRLIYRLKKMQFEGKFKRKADAVRWLKKIKK